MQFNLVNSETSSRIISTKDAYLANFSDFDRQSRLQVSKPISISEVLEFLAKQTLDWTDRETHVINKIGEELEEFYCNREDFDLDEVFLIKTTGLEECDAAYTRGKAIYLPYSMARWPYNPLKETIAHELFHVISTYNPRFRNRLYQKLEFQPCSDLEIPDSHKKLAVSNPDTIGKNCQVNLRNNGSLVKAVPFLYSTAPYSGGYFFEYFRYSFIACDVTSNKCLPEKVNGKPIFINPPDSLFKLCEEIDPYNNQHRLHPEEILAYYWSYLIFPKTHLEHFKSSFVSKIEKLLLDNSK